MTSERSVGGQSGSAAFAYGTEDDSLDMRNVSGDRQVERFEIG